MVPRLALVVSFLLLFLDSERAKADDLWCYQCNTNLKEGRKTECNDPYIAGSTLDLLPCHRNESHHCLKSIILYKSILTTVRSCVPTRFIDSYCRLEQFYPGATIECYFCNDYACNAQARLTRASSWSVVFVTMYVVIFGQ